MLCRMSIFGHLCFTRGGIVVNKPGVSWVHLEIKFSSLGVPRNGTTDGQKLGGKWTFGDALPSCTWGVEF